MGEKESIGNTNRRRFFILRFDFPRLLRWVLVLILYLTTFSVLDKLANTFQIFPGVVEWYPPDGLSLAFLLTFGMGFTPAFTLASLISSLLINDFSTPLGPILVWAVILSAIYGINAIFLRRRICIDPQLKNLRDTLWLILTSTIVSTVLAMISVYSLINYGDIPASEYIYAFVHWWIGEMIGVLVVTPFLLIHVMPWLKRFIDGEWPNLRLRNIHHKPSLLALGKVISIPIALYLVFGIPALTGFRPYFLIAGPLMWIALTNGFSMVSLAIVVMSFGKMLAIWLFKFDTSSQEDLQFLMFGTYLSALLTGAIVTKQKKTEEELQQREILNRALIENAPDAITLLGADGLLKYLSPSTQRILGYAPEEQVGSNPAEFTHPDDLPALLTLLDNLGQQPRKVVTTLYRFRHKDGSWRWLESTITNLLTEPSVQAIVFNFRDITERKQADETLEKSEKRFRAIVEHSLEEISLVDVDGTLTYESPSSSRPLGYPPNSFLGYSLFDLFHPDDKAGAVHLLKQVIQHPDTVHEASFRMRHQDGSWRWIEGSISNLLNEPAVQSIVINYRDVTEQKKAADALLEMLERNTLQASLLDQVRNAVIATDLDGKIFYWNKFAQTLYQWKAEEVIGKPVQEVTVPEDEIGLSEKILASIQQIGYWEGEFIVNRKDGSLFPAHVVDSLIINTEGRVSGFVGVSIDITERVRAEEAVRSSEKRYRSLFENMLEGFAYCKMLFENNLPQDYIYIEVNSKFEQLTGLTNVVGKKVSEVLPGLQTSNPELLEIYGRVALTGEPERFETYLEQLGIWLSIAVYSPETEYFVAVFDNITERKQAEEEINNSNNELSMLFNLSHSLAEADNLDDILNLVNRHAVESIHITFARIALLEGENYTIRSAYPIRPLDHDLRVNDRNPVASLPYSQRILEQNEPIILRARDSGISNEEKKALLLDFAQSLCLIPLRINDSTLASEKLIGLLMLGEARNESREPFTPQKMRLAQTIGDSAAIAIRRILLREQTDRRLTQLIALSEIDLAILSSSDMILSLRIVLLQVLEQLKVDAADVWLFNPTLQVLEFVSGRGFRTQAFENAEPLHLGEGFAGRAALERRTIHVSNLIAHNDNPRFSKTLADEHFLSHYAVPLIVKGQVKGVLELFHRTELEPNEEWLKFLQALANQAAIAIDNSSLFNDLLHSNTELTQAYDATIQGWSRALDLRDNETEGHTQRVTELTTKLGRQFGLSEEELVHVRRGALLHDIGKMGVPDGILLKPGPLTDEEWVVMRKHATFAFELLSPIHFLRPAIDIPYCHHEKWDGAGYPRGLSGDQIPLAARIFAVVDVWDALTSDRPYRAAWPEEKTLDHIRSLSATHFDPQVVKLCLDSGLLQSHAKMSTGMEPLQWTEKFSVGVSELDKQHQQLIKLVNRLLSATGTISIHSETITDILEEMTRYAQMHFNTEERLMEAYAYPGLEEQKVQHNDFRKKTIDFIKNTTIEDEQISEVLLEFLTNWLTHHILEDDMAYRPFFKEKGLK